MLQLAVDTGRPHDVVVTVPLLQADWIWDIEGNIDPARLTSVLHYDGTPITARFIISDIAHKLPSSAITPLRKAAP